MHISLFQVEALEQDVLEIVGLVQSMKNSFTPIGKFPSDIFSLILGHLEDRDTDKTLITMTHVCRRWRELLITRPSLWVRLDCKNAEKTQVYIERSELSPLKLSLCDYGGGAYLKDAFLLVVPHISRLKSLAINGTADPLQYLTPHLSCSIPLLSELTINLSCDPTPVLNTALFNGDLSSLCSLTLAGVITHLPWKNLSELTTFEFSYVEGETSITQLLDFFEDAYHLRDIVLRHSIPPWSDAPPGRVISLPHLNKLTISADPVHSIILDHLSIPAGASLTLNFEFDGDESPVSDFLPKTLENLGNIFPISSVNLSFGGVEKYARLGGPNGRLYMLGHWIDWEEGEVFTLDCLDRRILRSLSRFDLSGTQRLAVAWYEPPTVDAVDKSAPYHILSCMKDLHTLTLTHCNNLPFILALNPGQNSLKYAPCPKLEELVLYVEGPESFNVEDLMSMAKERASGGVKLSSIMFVGLGELLPGKEVFKLKKYITHVDYRVGEKPPRWDDVPGDEDD